MYFQVADYILPSVVLFSCQKSSSDDLGAFLTDLYHYQQRVVQTGSAGGLWDEVCSTETTMVECVSINPPQNVPVGLLRL